MAMKLLADLATRWPRLNALLDRALDVSPAERAAWLEALEGEPAELKDTLRRLLEARAKVDTNDFMSTLPRLAEAAPSALAELREGVAIGPYRLVRELGHGGMGSVWLAERSDGQLKRNVALKLPHLIWGGNLGERLARERDILATLEHPNIARLYDAGVDALGRPWMAMEFVQGRAIDDYARERQLDVPARLALLLQVCGAVAYAHSRLVIHRDLKPSNILVTDDGQVRLLDFGIAKLVQGESAAATALTQAAGRALTPDYASPEQVRGQALSTASDVYSLGVVAYELLTGQRPYRLKRGSAAELEEAIVGADVPLASDAAGGTAMQKRLRGDLDAILNKALKKDRRDRYATADALAQDLQRHLEQRPVLAQPDRLGYRAGKFVRRWRLPVAIGGLAAVAVLAGAGIALVQAREARLQAERARTEAATAQAVQGFIENVFRANSSDQADPQKARETTARQLLDLGAARIQGDLDGTPQAHARMLGVLASMYADMGLYQRALELSQQRVDLSRRAFDANSTQMVQALTEHSRALTNVEQARAAMQTLAEADAILDALGDQESAERYGVEAALANTARRFSAEEANAAAKRAVSIARQGLPTASLVRALYLEAQSAIDLGRLDSAVETLQEVIRMVEADAALGRGQLVDMYGQLGDAQMFRGDLEAGIANLRKSLEVAKTTPGTPPLAVHSAAWQLSSQLAARVGGFREAIDLLRPGYEWARSGQSDVPEVAANIATTYARFLGSYGRVDESLAVLDEVPGLLKGEAGHANIKGPGMLARASALIDQGRYAEAERTAEQARALFAGMNDLEEWVHGATRTKRRVETASGQAATAWADFQEEQARLAGRQVVRGVGPRLVRLESAQLQLASGSVDAARNAAEKLLAEVQRLPSRRYESQLEADASVVVGRSALAQGDRETARLALQHAVQIYKTIFDVEYSLTLADALGFLAQSQRALRDEAGATQSLEEAGRIHARHSAVGAHHLAVLRDARKH